MYFLSLLTNVDNNYGNLHQPLIAFVTKLISLNDTNSSKPQQPLAAFADPLGLFFKNLAAELRPVLWHVL
jgi:hypothetical protein